jgi:lipid II:glycine glycyltransferase (peptidoglycan interpeptide bridge formation enzyme)
MKLEILNVDQSTWNAWLADMPNAHLLQTWEWGSLKKISGWRSQFFVWRNEGEQPQAMAMVLVRALPAPWKLTGLKIMYIPKGPVLDWENTALRHQVLDDLANSAKQNKAIFLKIDPDICLGKGIPGSDQDWQDPLGAQILADLKKKGWAFSSEQIQFKNTVEIDLSPGKDLLLGQMKQKTRYNVRLALRKGISVRVASEQDLDRLYDIYAETSLRDGFVIRERDYYISLWRVFLHAGRLIPLMAEYEGDILAGLMLFHFGRKCWYIHGMSVDEHREKMPNYLLQWDAMQKAVELGCHHYDLWGAPDVFDEDDSMWGVFKFKQGLGGQVVRTIGAWDLPVRPFWYRLYAQVLPRWLDWMRKRGIARTRKEVEH